MKMSLFSNYLLFAFFFHSLILNAQENDHYKIPPNDVFNTWNIEELLPGGRFDALAYLNNDVVIIGSRGKNPGHIFRSKDLGNTWERFSNVTPDQITCLTNGNDGLAYMLTDKANFYCSEDYGKTWEWKAKISDNEKYGNFALSYGLVVTDQGSVLVSDTEPTGGHIYRSIDRGKTWKDLGVISEKPLYRFERTDNGILVNGWGGNIYKSKDDGITWNKTQHLSDTPLYATEYMGSQLALQASESGHIYRSQNCGESWDDLGKLTEAADDFVKLGTGGVLLTTYTEAKNLYLSIDYGKTWKNIGIVNPKIKTDWFDHVIYIDKPGKVIIIGGTNKGFVVRAEIFRDNLNKMVNGK